MELLQYHNITAELDVSSNRGKFLIDGVPLKGIEKYTIEAATDECTRFTVTFVASLNHDKN